MQICVMFQIRHAWVPGNYDFQVRMAVTDLCTGLMSDTIIDLTMVIAPEPAACFDYADECSSGGVVIYPGPSQVPGSFSISGAGPATIDPTSGDIDVSGHPCGDAPVSLYCHLIHPMKRMPVPHKICSHIHLHLVHLLHLPVLWKSARVGIIPA